jgi:hypothetical protein
MIRKPDLVYQTPPGYEDKHYIYAFDAVQAGLVAGNDYLNLRVPTFADSDFILRKIDGLSTVIGGAVLAGRFSVYDKDRMLFSSDPMFWANTANPGPFPVLPEKMYPRQTEIGFDLYTYGPGLYFGDDGGNTPASQLLFYGVKRTPASKQNLFLPYRLSPYTYTMQVLFNWGLTTGPPLTGLDLAPRQFYVEVRNYDFELWGMHAVAITPGRVGAQAKVQLYDANDSARYNQSVFFNLVDYRQIMPGTTTVIPGGSAIVPPLVYPVKSQLRIDLQSYYWTTDINFPYLVEFNFFGAERIPV